MTDDTPHDNVVPEAAQVDLTMPEGLTDEQRVVWLHEVGAELRRVTGRASGSTPTQDVGQGQPVWGLWWSDD